MKIISTILVLLALTGCYPNYNQYASLHNAFIQGCSFATVESTLNTAGDTLILHATCIKAK